MIVLLKFSWALAASNELHEEFDAFVLRCESKSELCKFFGNFQKIVAIIKKLIAADRRKGNWLLHAGTGASSMAIRREFDAIYYLRYASWYLERINVLEVENSTLYLRFFMGYSVGKDRASGIFSAVAPDMKLEQSIFLLLARSRGSHHCQNFSRCWYCG